MHHQNIYKIATIVISITGYTSELFQSYMHPYKDFRVEESDNIDLEIDIDKSLDDVGFTSVSVDNVDNMIFEQYINENDGRMKVRAKYADTEYIMIASKDFSKVKTNAEIKNPISAYILDRFILISFLARALDFNILKIHSSAIYKDGNAIAFLGVSGTGKSTHSKLWLEHIDGADLLNDDEPFLKINNDGSAILYGAPWSGSTNCFKNISYPLKAIVHLEQSKQNSLTRKSAIHSLESLLLSINTLKMYDGMKNKQYDLILKVLERVPVYKLECRPDKEAVLLTSKLLD